MRKLPQVSQELNDHDCCEVTVEVHKCYHAQRDNSFGDILPGPACECIRMALIGFVKCAQEQVTQSPDNKVYVRMWRNVSSDTNFINVAYSLIVKGPCVSVLDDAYKDYKKKKEVQGINFRFIVPYYDSLCKKTLCDTYQDGENEYVDYSQFLKDDDSPGVIYNPMGEDQYNSTGEEGDNYEVEDEDDEDPYQNPQEESRSLPSTQQTLTFTSVFSRENTNRLLSEGYVPVVDFELLDNQMFYWEALSLAHFPWHTYNEFERRAQKFMNKVKHDMGVYSEVPTRLDLLVARWSRKDLSDTLQAEREAEEEAMENTRSRPSKRNKFSYFSTAVLKKIKNRIKNSSVNRIYDVSWSDPRAESHKDLKEPITLLNKVMGEIHGDPDLNDDQKHKLSTQVFEDFWTCIPIYESLSVPQKALYQHFLKVRGALTTGEPFQLILNGDERSIMEMILGNILKCYNVIFGLGHSGTTQMILQIVARESTCNPKDTNNFNVFTVGEPGIGKSYVAMMLSLVSVPGTINYNTIDASSKSEFVGKNNLNFSTKVINDAPPSWTTDKKKANEKLRELQRKLLSIISEGRADYSVFAKMEGQGMDPLLSRICLNISNQCMGSYLVCGNDLPGTKELEQRCYLQQSGDSKAPNYSTLDCKIRSELSESFEETEDLRRVLAQWMQQLQADGAMFNFYDAATRREMYNTIVSLLVANFCFGRLSEELPFFQNESRKLNNLMFIAMAFACYRIKVQMCNIPGGKYYGVEKIDNVGEFCREFAMRAYVGYEEVIPALFFMLSQYVDNVLIDLVDVFMCQYLNFDPDSMRTYGVVPSDGDVEMDEGTRGTVEPSPGGANTLKMFTAKHLERWNSVVVNSVQNFNSDFRVEFLIEERRARGGGSGGGGGEEEEHPIPVQENRVPSHFRRDYENREENSFSSNNNTSNDTHGGSGMDFTSVSEKWIDPNKICFITSLDKGLFISQMAKHLKREMPESTVRQKLKELQKQTIKTKYFYQKIKLQTDRELTEDDFESARVEQSAEFNCLKLIEDNKQTKYIFASAMFDVYGVSPYEVLKRIVVEDLPYEEQGEDIEVVAVKLPELCLERLTISARNSSRKNFVVNNPKHLNKNEQVYYGKCMHKYLGMNLSERMHGDRFYQAFVTKEKFRFDFPLWNLAEKKHSEVFSVSAEVSNEIREEAQHLFEEYKEDETLAREEVEQAAALARFQRHQEQQLEDDEEEEGEDENMEEGEEIDLMDQVDKVLE